MKDNINTAKQVVMEAYNMRHTKQTKEEELKIEDVYVVWFCEILQNWKALVSTDRPDARYYEVTYNGDRDEIYLDIYIKEWAGFKKQ